MRIEDDRLLQIESDLGLNSRYVKGETITVRDCWHFMTDGNAIDAMFLDYEDFRCGMNRIPVVLQCCDVRVLAFCLMDTHVHFVLYGPLSECKHFMHRYLQMTSAHLSRWHGERSKLLHVPVDYQHVDNDRYLKTVICYTVKNPPAGGLPYNFFDYPWSSGPLYFRSVNLWSTPRWISEPALGTTNALSVRKKRDLLHTKSSFRAALFEESGLVFPGEYVAYELVERLFRTHKAYNYFMCFTKESDVEALEGAISRLTLPMQEMRQHRNDLCVEMFGTDSIRKLDTAQRIRLAKALKHRYDSSLKQIARLTGLVYEEVKNLI